MDLTVQIHQQIINEIPFF